MFILSFQLSVETLICESIKMLLIKVVIRFRKLMKILCFSIFVSLFMDSSEKLAINGFFKISYL